MQDDTRAVLGRVVAKAGDLRRSRYLTQLIDQNYKIDFSGAEIKVLKPDDEALAAFVLHLRFFIAANEATSFRRLAELANGTEVSERWKQRFTSVRSAINDYLQTSVGEYDFNKGRGKERFTNWEILETFLYGGLAHANDPVLVRRHQEWQESAGMYALLGLWFTSTLQALLRAIFFLSTICEEELRQSDPDDPQTGAA
ncbi:MAG: hypothetical protein IT185_10280 [Acidobacteria bacterium]|nr:hypothetical protein [Acidobacteriota bacterium]